MLHHGAILSNIAGAIDVLGELGLGDDVFLSFLPLSHAYEHTVGQFLPIALGSEIYYAESVDRVAANLREARPTILSRCPASTRFCISASCMASASRGACASGCSSPLWNSADAASRT